MENVEAYQKANKLLSNWHWRLNNLYYITDKSGNKVQFKMNWAQEQLFNDMHYMNVILKARQLGFCLDPKTKVLTSELRWVEIQNLNPGDEVVAVDEERPGGRGRQRKMRTAEVQGVVEVFRKSYKITLSSGKEIICTGQHPWLCRKAATDSKWMNILGSEGRPQIKVGTRIRRVCEVWGDESSYEDGWFGGMLDGEGSIALPKATGAEVNVSQRENVAWDRMVRYLKDNKYNYRVESDHRKAGDSSKLGNKVIHKACVSRINELFRLIGKTRPSRFIGNRFWEGKELPGKGVEGSVWETVVSIEEMGEQRLIDLQTSEGTYIAEGLVSHNTTFIEIFMLDAAVFNKDIRCGTIAHTLDDAKVIFRDKIKYPYDNLPEMIRQAVPIVNSNSTELLLGNNSGVRVGTSLRSGTLQYLHISEYGKICAKFPDKAREIRTGALNTVDAGQLVFIESTAEGQEGHFYDVCQEAQSMQRKGNQLSELDFRFHFYPWWRSPEYEVDQDTVVVTEEYVKYFDGLEENHGIVLNARQRAWYAAKAKTQGADMKREYPSTPEEAFEASVEGAYYADELAKAELEGRIGKHEYLPNITVHTAWDIGVGDYTAIWFYQIFNGKIGLIDYYENSGEGAIHYLKILYSKAKANGWRYGQHNLPHDVAVREWGSGLSRIEQLTAGIIIDGVKFSVNPTKVPNISIDDGRNAVRELFKMCYFNESSCAEGLKSLKNYRKSWNEKAGTWSEDAAKSWANHGSDAFRYLCVSYKEEQKAQEKPKNKTLQNATLNDLWKTQPKRSDRI